MPVPEITEAERQKAVDNYKLTQKQRYNEAQIRKYKRPQKNVTDPAKQKEYAARVKDWQKRNQQLCDTHPDILRRDYNREKVWDEEIKPKTLDISGGSGIIKERSSGKGNRSTDHYAEKIGTIDFNDKNAVAKSLVEFETKYMESDIEHCRVITPSGDVFEVHGDRYTVDTSILGDKLKGSINEHNHVTGESQYSFSWEDLASSVSDGSEMSLAYDERYRYWMIMPDYPISESQLYEAYQNAITSVGDDLIFSPEKIPEGDEQHERIKRACEELGIRYQRILIAD